MSWSSDCAEYCKEVRENVRNRERVDKHILDSNLMILEVLSAIADMLERSEDDS
jgi:hypothetical protein